MNKLTDHQQSVLDFLKSYSRENRMPPTRMEICKHFGWSSPHAAQTILIRLATAKAIRFIPKVSRGIVIL